MGGMQRHGACHRPVDHQASRRCPPPPNTHTHTHSQPPHSHSTHHPYTKEASCTGRSPTTLSGQRATTCGWVAGSLPAGMLRPACIPARILPAFSHSCTVWHLRVDQRWQSGATAAPQRHAAAPVVRKAAGPRDRVAGAAQAAATCAQGRQRQHGGEPGIAAQRDATRAPGGDCVTLTLRSLRTALTHLQEVFARFRTRLCGAGGWKQRTQGADLGASTLRLMQRWAVTAIAHSSSRSAPLFIAMNSGE